VVFIAPRKAVAAWLALVASQVVFAAEIVHQEPSAFLDEYLPGCEQKALWLKKDTRAEIEKLLDRPYPGVRVRYCTAEGRTAWILDEIGKTEPITSGIVVDNGKVESLRVLVFRESRGGEVHREAFTRQFAGAALDDGHLDQNIDGITGATLSVSAVERQVRLALLLDRITRGDKGHDG
jgi:hypothetical protein